MEKFQEAFSVSIRGASHIKSGKPMQDYSLAVSGENFSLAIVCDGHGADKHFRSEVGAMLAAQAAKEQLLKFQDAFPAWSDFSNNVALVLERLKLGIIANWQSKIEQHAADNPFTEEERQKMSRTFQIRGKYDIASPYGTTLLVALIRNNFCLYLMIGDGAIVEILPDFSSEIVHFPGKPTYDDQPHSATDSICEPDCFSKLFAIAKPNVSQSGIAVALCSDGLSEAFNTDMGLMEKLINYLNFYAEEGLEKAKNAIEQQLNELSRLSPMKDDISLAFATNSLPLYDRRDKSEEAQTETAESVSDADKETK